MDCYKIISVFVGIFLIFNYVPSYSEVNSLSSPVGYWKTIDMLTGKPKSIIQISKSVDNTLVGKIVKIYPVGTKDKTALCTACTGDKRNQPMLGMTVLSDLKSSSHHWDNGQIFDFENGKTYRCALHMTENGKKLKVQGYIGLPLFGHSQIWERVDLMAG